MKLEIKSLYKKYGNLLALSDVTFSINSGETIGLLGRNGAGKTTLIKCIMKIIDSDSGKISYDNSEFSIGYLPEERGLYLNSTVYEQLVYFANLNHLDKAQTKSQIKKYLSRFGIDKFASKKIKTLSKGNKQKVQLISALLHEPDLIILDEPFSGLDPVNAELFKNVVNEEKDNGRIIILSSHRMEDIEELCDRVIMLKKGQVLLNNTIDELIEQYSLKKQYCIESNDDISDIIKNINGLTLISKNSFSYELKYEDINDIKKLQLDILNNGFEIVSCGHPTTTLQKIFVKELSDDAKKA